MSPLQGLDHIPNSDSIHFSPPMRPPFSKSPPRLAVIGAGARGTVFGKAVTEATNGLCVCIIEPLDLKRRQFGKRFIWGETGQPSHGQEFHDWRDFISWERDRRAKAASGEHVPEGCDGVFICVQDHMHKEIILACAPLDIHIMCEKPLATNLQDCLSIHCALKPQYSVAPAQLFSIGHVLRYTPHNMLLRKLLLEDRAIGDVLTVNHTEPVGWWHFAHSFVRGNWRNQATSAPSLLTKTCHDLDLLLWLLCSPAPRSSEPPHLPSTVSSAGSVQYFRKSRKPMAAGDATNCLSCDFEASCKFSAKRLYLGSKFPGLGAANTDWPLNVLVPEIEDVVTTGGLSAGQKAVLAKLRENYDESMPAAEISKRPWYGRCVYECDNDVCDNQTVTLTFDDLLPSDEDIGNGNGKPSRPLRPGKIATLHLVALTKRRCERYTHISGTDGEIYADSFSIAVHDFSTGQDKTYYPHVVEGGGHGDGDCGLARQFVLAIDRVKNHGEAVEVAQQDYIGCSLEEVIRSHALVFAAEEARLRHTTVDFPAWWDREVESKLTD